MQRPVCPCSIEVALISAESRTQRGRQIRGDLRGIADAYAYGVARPWRTDSRRPIAVVTGGSAPVRLRGSSGQKDHYGGSRGSVSTTTACPTRLHLRTRRDSDRRACRAVRRHRIQLRICLLGRQGAAYRPRAQTCDLPRPPATLRRNLCKVNCAVVRCGGPGYKQHPAPVLRLSWSGHLARTWLTPTAYSRLLSLTQRLLGRCRKGRPSRSSRCWG